MNDAAAGAAPVIEVRDLRKSFAGTEAVRGLDLTVSRGEVLAILGPNGAGKTTTVEILEGYVERDAGEVTVLGLDPAGAPRALRQRIGIVLQECGIDRFLTCRELLQQHASFYRAPRDPDALLELVGLSAKADERVRRLSGGQQRRLDLALGMVGSPELLFLDEPTTGFDPQARQVAWDIVKRLAADGTTIVLTTHYLDEAQALADRVVVVVGGRIVAEGRPDEIGRAGAAARISFRATDGARAAAGFDEIGGRMVADVHDPVPALHELTGWALREGVRLEDLSVAKPTLEQGYLALIGEFGSEAGKEDE